MKKIYITLISILAISASLNTYGMYSGNSGSGPSKEEQLNDLKNFSTSNKNYNQNELNTLIRSMQNLNTGAQYTLGIVTSAVNKYKQTNNNKDPLLIKLARQQPGSSGSGSGFGPSKEEQLNDLKNFSTNNKNYNQDELNTLIRSMQNLNTGAQYTLGIVTSAVNKYRQTNNNTDPLLIKLARQQPGSSGPGTGSGSRPATDITTELLKAANESTPATILQKSATALHDIYERGTGKAKGFAKDQIININTAIAKIKQKVSSLRNNQGITAADIPAVESSIDAEKAFVTANTN